ncbi:MAG: hypothetical protein Q4C66_07070 [Lachnospiraceae bacterium]|nr:hypothetical protein [Lachnospiraceae bacterium]
MRTFQKEIDGVLRAVTVVDGSSTTDRKMESLLFEYNGYEFMPFDKDPCAPIDTSDKSIKWGPHVSVTRNGDVYEKIMSGQIWMEDGILRHNKRDLSLGTFLGDYRYISDHYNDYVDFILDEIKSACGTIIEEMLKDDKPAGIKQLVLSSVNSYIDNRREKIFCGTKEKTIAHLKSVLNEKALAMEKELANSYFISSDTETTALDMEKIFEHI